MILLRKSTVVLFLVAIFLIAWGENVNSKEATFSVNGITFVFDPGEEYCAADPINYPKDREVLDYFRKVGHGQMYVMGVFFRCAYMQRVRSGGEAINWENEDFATLSAAMSGPNEIVRLPEISRADFLKEYSAMMGAGNISASVAEETVKRLNDNMPVDAAKLGKMKLTAPVEAGVIDIDEAALYTAALVPASWDNEDFNNAVVGFSTSVKRLLVTYALAGSLESSQTWLRLLNSVKAAANRLAERYQ